MSRSCVVVTVSRRPQVSLCWSSISDFTHPQLRFLRPLRLPRSYLPFCLSPSTHNTHTFTLTLSFFLPHPHAGGPRPQGRHVSRPVRHGGDNTHHLPAAFVPANSACVSQGFTQRRHLPLLLRLSLCRDPLPAEQRYTHG